ncbi:MFS transporter [Halotalea alkalilenta]|uniref:MFS transporter n=1 Tax=Halotalea alkalilenta TaxID=376489 RepID=A0A172YJ03_9GAMM|nr:MFS transporter [Halotalea alkalilenta]ANF59197.1 MFS transporter [Halotalea alkalilenta]
MNRLFKVKATSMVLVMLCLMYFITYVDRVNVSTAAGQFSAELGLTNTQLGFIFSAFAYPYLVFQFIGGWVSDRFGAKRTLIVCAFIWATATVLTGLAGGFLSLVAARMLLGLGEGATFPAATSAMSAWVAKDKRGFAQGITHSAARLGNAMAPMIVAALMTAYDWRFSFYLLGGLSFGWIVLWYATYTEKPADHPRITQQELDSLPPPKPARGPDAPGTWMRLFRRMLPVSSVYFCYNWILWLMLSWIPMYFMHNYQLNIKDAVLYTSGVFFAGVLGDLLGGVLSDKILRRTGNLKLARSYLVAVCMGLTGLSLIPVLMFQEPMYSLVFLGLALFFNEMIVGPMWAVPMDIANDRAGTASGIMNGTAATATIISPVLAGYLIDQTGNWSLPFLISIGVLACGVLLTFTMKPQRAFDANATSKPVMRTDFS